jgi:chromosome segregation ATPase
MTEPNNHSLKDNQNEQALSILKNEIDSLKFQLKKKDGRIADLDAFINTLMGSHNAEIRAYEDLKDKLDDVIDKLSERVPHSDILDYLKVKDRNQV